MLTRFDKVIAPHICQFFLLLVLGISAFIFLLINDVLLKSVLGVMVLALCFFNLRIYLLRHERSRVFNILYQRIQKQGYNKELLRFKCNTICQLCQAIYIALRFGAKKDIPFLWQEFRQKKTSFIYEDENMEKVLNNLKTIDLPPGKIIHEFER
jgi:hypothetical protein